MKYSSTLLIVKIDCPMIRRNTDDLSIKTRVMSGSKLSGYRKSGFNNWQGIKEIFKTGLDSGDAGMLMAHLIADSFNETEYGGEGVIQSINARGWEKVSEGKRWRDTFHCIIRKP